MKEIPRISDAEWEIMHILWQRSPLTANEVFELLEQRIRWKPNTVKTLIGRLVKKGAVHYRKEGKTYLYSPAVSQDECIRAESRSFLDRIFGGALKPMLVHFLEEEPLSPEEIRELKNILEKKDREK